MKEIEEEVLTEGEKYSFKRPVVEPPNCGDFREKANKVWCGRCKYAHTIPNARLNAKGELVKVR